jgi:hypothetical protein
MATTVGEFKKRIQAATDFNPRLTSEVLLRYVRSWIRKMAIRSEAFKRSYDIAIGSSGEREYIFQTEDNIISVDKLEYGSTEDFLQINQTQQKVEKLYYETDMRTDVSSGVQGLVIRLKFEPTLGYWLRPICSVIPDGDLSTIWAVDTNVFTSVIPETWVDALEECVVASWKKEYDRDKFTLSYIKDCEDEIERIAQKQNERLDIL